MILPFPKNNDLFDDEAKLIGHLKDRRFTICLFDNSGLLSLFPNTLEAYTEHNLYGNGSVKRLTCMLPGMDKKSNGSNEMIPRKSPVWITEKLCHAISADLISKPHSSDLVKLSNYQQFLSFVYIDISDFSKFSPGQQLCIVNNLVFTSEYVVNNCNLERFISSMCIGDGYIYVFKKTIDAAQFAASLAAHIEVFAAKLITNIEYFFRIGMHCGFVYTFWDPAKNDWNYIGEGINGGNRILSAAGKDTDNTVYMSGQMRSRLISENSGDVDDRHHDVILSSLRNMGRRLDKHNKMWRVYELNFAKVAEIKPGIQYRQIRFEDATTS